MNLLLDTHTVIWLLAWPDRLSPQALTAIEDGRNGLWVSMASVWEAEIKQATGKLHLPSGIWDELSMKGIQFLPIERVHCQMLAKLPFHHRDPFDRMLVAQALCESLTLVSADAALLSYPAPILW